MRQPRGFTLAELLIALAILGVIATFTIPKVLVAQQDAKFTAIGKEVAGMISGAYQAYQLNSGVSANTSGADLTQYMNYVRVDTASTIDGLYTQGTDTCSSTGPCLVLHNGARLKYRTLITFGSTATTSAIFFRLDPDANYSTTTDAPGKTLSIWLYYDGKIRTYGTIEANTYYTSSGVPNGPNGPNSTVDPPWFSWD